MVDPYKAIWATLVYITVPFLMATMLITEALDIFFHLITFGALRYAPPTQPLHEKACQVSVSEAPFQEVCSKKSTQVENNFVYKTPTRKSVQKTTIQAPQDHLICQQKLHELNRLLQPYNAVVTNKSYNHHQIYRLASKSYKTYPHNTTARLANAAA